MKTLWIILAALILLTPLGLLASGTAWGEWGRDELRELGLGFAPEGMEKLASIWQAPIPDYEIPGLDASVGYVLSAILGVVIIVLITWLLGRWLAKSEDSIRG